MTNKKSLIPLACLLITQWSLLGSNSHCLLLFTENGNKMLLKYPTHDWTLKWAVLPRFPSFWSVVFAIAPPV